MKRLDGSEMRWYHLLAIGFGIGLLISLFAGCGPTRECQQVEVVVVNGCRTLDLGWCHTVVQLENGSRVKIKGKWGEVGDTFTAIKYGNAWKACEE